MCIKRLYDFRSGETIYSNQVNEEFNQIIEAVNKNTALLNALINTDKDCTTKVFEITYKISKEIEDLTEDHIYDALHDLFCFYEKGEYFKIKEIAPKLGNEVIKND